MGLLCVENSQHIELFDEDEGAIWKFTLDWHQESIRVERNQQLCGVVTNAQFPPQQQYLEQLTQPYK